jgi:hypothetical protein
MIEQQENIHELLDGQHQANDPVSSDMRDYYKDTLKLNHPLNRRRTDAKIPSRDNS